MKVLVLEPIAEHRELLGVLLAQEGFEAELAATAKAALSRLEHDPLAFGAVLVALPELALVRTLRAQDATRDLPALVVASSIEPADLEQAYGAGAIDYVRKPFERTELRVRLGNAVRLRAETAARKARESELESTSRALDASLAELRGDLAAAAALQRRLLPDPSACALPIAGHFEPCSALGGDLFGANALPDGRVALFMIDVAGHGVRAALTAVAVHRMLTAAGAESLLVDAYGAVRDPAQVVARLDRQFVADGDPMQYFTLCLLIADPRDGSVELVQAGSPPLLVLEHGEVHTFDAGDAPVGLAPGMEFRTHRLALGPGARLVLYSDGIVDAGSRQGRFGLPRLAAAARDVQAAGMPSLAALVERLVAAARQFAGAAGFDDDASMLAVAMDRVHAE